MTCSLENYELEYKLYLAESEYFKNIIDISYVIKESENGLLYIHETVKDIILKYVSKIVTAIEAAWKKIIEIFSEGPDTIYLKAIKNVVNNLKNEPAFSVTNFKNYNENNLSTVKLLPLDYMKMKETLDSTNHFLQANYTNIPNIGNGDIKAAIANFCITNIENSHKITLQEVKNFYQWCSNDYKTSIDGLKADIASLNTSNSNIQSLVNQISTTESVNNLNYIFESYILEADENTNDQKMKFQDDQDKNPDGTSKESDMNNQLTKEIQIYMSASTEILTAKMNLLKDRRKDYIAILKHLISPKDFIPNKSNNPNGTAEQNIDKYTINI